MSPRASTTKHAIQLAERGEFKKALKLFQKNNSYFNAALCYNNLGNIELRNKRYNNAIIYYKKALKLKSSNYIFLDNLATAYRESGKITTAVKLYKKVLTIKSNYDLSLLNLELSLMKICDWSELSNYDFSKYKKTPFMSIITEDNPRRNLKKAKAWI
jgi:tetratricopeptide (TPR) repeat protein